MVGQNEAEAGGVENKTDQNMASIELSFIGLEKTPGEHLNVT